MLCRNLCNLAPAEAKAHAEYSVSVQSPAAIISCSRGRLQ